MGVEYLEVDLIRSQIPACQRTTYLNTGWSGPSPRCVVEAIQKRLQYESYEGPTTKPVYESGKVIQQQARVAVASLLKVSADEITLTQNTTDGLNIVLGGLPWQPNDELITFGLEHSSVLIPAYYLQQTRGVRVKTLPLHPGDDSDSIVARVEEAITDHTQLLFFSHIQYTCGLRMPVERLRDLTRAKGVKMLMDGAQTPGHIELDLRALDCEFYSIPGQKWLLGPDGVGALYVRRDLIPLVEPSRVSMRATLSYDDRGGFEPNNASIDKFQLTTSSVPLIAGFAEAIRFHEEAGPNAVEKRTLTLASHLKHALSVIPKVAVDSPIDESQSCGLTSFHIQGIDANEVVDRLWRDHNIVVRQVGELACVRVSTHIFNTEEEIERIAGAVRRMAA